MSHELHIRIDWLDTKSYQTDSGMDTTSYDNDNIEFLAEVYNKILSTAEAYATVHETGKSGTQNPNPHEHIYIKCARKCKDMQNDIRAILKKWNAIGKAHKGNAAYSCKNVRDYIKCLNYLAKQGIVEYSNIPEEDIAAAREYQRSYEERENLKKLKAQGFFPSLRIEVEEQPWYGDLHINKPDTQREYNARRSLMKFIIEAHRKHERLIRATMIQVYYDTILAYADNGHEYEFLVSRLRL